MTTGSNDCVVWNEIHHKTEINNSNGHGYPDPKYLENVREELAAQGVMYDVNSQIRSSVCGNRQIRGK